MKTYATTCYYLMIAAAFALDHAPAPAPLRVVSVHDGDTLRVVGETASVRLAGIDAPELSQPFGRAARDRLRALALGKAAVLTPATGRDKWGRTLATVTVDGADLGLTLVCEGLAYAWHPKGTRAPSGWPALVAAEASARAEGRGAWADATAERPWDYRAKPKGQPAASRAEAAAPAPTIEAELLRHHNVERAKAKAPPLRIDPRLTLAARWQAEDCARGRYLDHVGLDGSRPGTRIARAGYAYSACAENAGWQPLGPLKPDGAPYFPQTTARMMASWKASPGHWRAVVNPAYRDFGAAVARDGRGDSYWITCFGRPR